MNYELIDIKLKSLIRVCKQTHNYRKLATVGLLLVGNVLDEIGVKLGIRPRNKEGNETIFQYMHLVNSILHHNFKIYLFQEDAIQSIKTTELLFSKNRGNIPLELISQIYEFFYEFRTLEIPNLFEKLDLEVIAQNSEMRAFSFFSGNTVHSKRKLNHQKLKEVIMHGFQEQEGQLQKELNEEYDREKFEKMIAFKNAKHAMQQYDGGKIMLRGKLKDNLIYQCSIPNIFGYLIFGLLLLFLMLGVIVAIQTIYHPQLTAQMSLFTLLFFGTGSFFFLLYRQYSKKAVVVSQ